MGTFIWRRVLEPPIPMTSVIPLLLILLKCNHIWTNRRYATDLDPGPGVSMVTPTGYGAFVQKLIPMVVSFGELLSGSSNIDAARAVATDVAGNVYVTGLFTGTSDFDPGPDIHHDRTYIQQCICSKTYRQWKPSGLSHLADPDGTMATA